MPVQVYMCENETDGSANIREYCPQNAAEAFVEAMARDGEVKAGDEISVKVTAPDGTVTRWRVLVTMEPMCVATLQEEQSDG